VDASPAIAGVDGTSDEATRLDAVAFTQLYYGARDGLFRYLRARCSNDDEAADLTATAFERAWRTRSRYRGGESGYLPWIYQIARRLTIDAARRRSAARRGLVFWPPPKAAPDPAEVILHDERDRLLADRLTSLSPLHREAIFLRYAAGLNSKQIGEVIGKSEEATQKLITRALGRLKEIYRDDE
jgi:RNA polymerase sigma-70 factor (ECF subfamily)